MRKLKSYLTLSSALILSLIVSMLFAIPVLAAGSITTSPLSGPAGSTVSISGTGFTAGSTYTITFDGTPIVGATGTITTPGGALTATSFVVPTAVAGAHNIQVTTTAGAGDTSNVRQFTVTPQITLSSTSVTVGTIIVVYGSGFGASRTVTIYIDSVARVTTTTNTIGTFSDSIQIPSGAGGTHTVTATDTALNTASTTYSVIPTVSLSSGSVTVGSQLTATGTNFVASTSVRIYIGSTLITTVSSSTTGSFTASITVPQGTYGSHTVTATDLSGNSAAATFSIIPSISANTTTITSGSQITVSGNGFTASSTVRFYLDNSLINGGTVNTNTVGSFSQSLVIPVITGGNHTLEARDTSSNSASLSFAITQGITVNPQSGTAGSNIQVTGKGFIANKSISIKLDGAAITTAPSSPVTNAGGEFTASFTIPAIFGGLHSIDVTDGTFSFSSSLSVTSGADISVIRGDVGTSVTVTGTSFGSNAAILMTFDGESVATVNADRNGAFSATFNVPPASGGNHTIIASDRTRNVSFNFFVKSTVVMTPTSGFVGTSITLTGSGFASQKSLAVKYDATTIPTTTQTDTKGGFTIVFNTPVSKGGSHSIIVTDGTNTITNTFSMDAASPPVPVLLSPLNKNGGTTPELQWNAVNDQSGVTYTLQVSRNINFNTLVIEKKGLTSPVYQVTEGEKLESASKQEPYYWRVKAIDGAANESAFSSTQSFYVGFVLANWALYLIFGIAIVVAFFLGFFLRGGNKTKVRNTPAPPSES